jgi:hypothetical protein
MRLRYHRKTIADLALEQVLNRHSGGKQNLSLRGFRPKIRNILMLAF